MKRNNKNQIISILYYMTFMVLFLFLLWKCRYGYANMDEAFYLTIPYRLCRGDSLIVHEWHLSQLSGFLLYPLMKIYLFLTGSTEGILLHFRYIFTCLWAFSAAFVFYRLKKFSLYGAMLSSVFYLLYTPFGIMALSYNSMGIMLLLSACVIMATAEKYAACQYMGAGVLFAGAVLCCPYLLILYLLFSVLAWLIAIKNRKILKAWFMMSLGCGIILLVFLLFVLKNTTISAISSALPELFNDPEHPSVSILRKTKQYMKAILYCNRVFPAAVMLTLLIMAVSYICKAPTGGFIALCAVVVMVQLVFLTEKPYLNYIMLPINMLAPYCLIHSRKKREIWLPFCIIWLPGGVYTWCICLSSNQWFYAASSASTVMTAASAVMIFSFVLARIPEIKSRYLRHGLVMAAVLLFSLQFYAELTMRYSSVFWEPQGMSAQTVCARNGPEKGIRMTPEKLEAYLVQERDMEIIRGDEEISGLLVLSENTRLYLSAEKDMSTFSAWISGVNEVSIGRLDAYFEMNPEKIPDGIYVEEEYAELMEHYLEKGYTCYPLESGSFLLK